MLCYCQLSLCGSHRPELFNMSRPLASGTTWKKEGCTRPEIIDGLKVKISAEGCQYPYTHSEDFIENLLEGLVTVTDY